MFQGVTQLSLDSKGRLAVPARHRDMLLAQCAGQLVLTADADGCLLLYPQPEWLPIREQLLKFPSFNPRARALQRLLIGHAEEVQLDNAGRLLISPALRAYAALDKRVMLLGQGNKFEVWDEARWQAQQEAMRAMMAEPLPAGLEGFSL